MRRLCDLRELERVAEQNHALRGDGCDDRVDQGELAGFVDEEHVDRELHESPWAKHHDVPATMSNSSLASLLLFVT